MSKRVLFTTPAGLGHIHPTVPLAQAMVQRGHDVVWAVPPDGVDHVERAGIRAESVGTAGLMSVPEVFRRYPELQALAPSEVPEVMFGKLFGAIAAPVVLADLRPFALEWEPDLVVADAGELAGHIVAAELDVPSATKAFGPLLTEGRVAAAGVEVAPLWESCGLEPRPYGGAYDHLYLDIFPTGLQPATAARVPRRQMLRPVTYDGPVAPSGPVPFPDGPVGAPRVYVTMGTVFNRPELFTTLIDAFADLDARVLVTVGPAADPTVLGPRHANIHVERYVPQTLVLAACDVVVSHSGSGTVVATLDHGLPQLCLPQGADQFLNANAVVGAGAGISLMPGEVTAEAIRDAVSALIEDESYRAAAERVKTSIASMPSPDEVAVVLESLAEQGSVP
jgi:UDP:flavonoid glycosyltransferase YjiC (YdhE family)